MMTPRVPDTLALVNSAAALVLGTAALALAIILQGWWILGFLPGAAAQSLGLLGVIGYRPDR